MIFEKEGRTLSPEEFHHLSGSKWISHLDFENSSLLARIASQGSDLRQKGKMSREQLWLGSYFQKEIRSGFSCSDLAIRWIDPMIGWGVFALRDFKKMEFIAEYTGKVRKRIKRDAKNGYCFEYAVVQGISSPYTIDAMDQGGVSRYLNHSPRPNLHSALATVENISHVILYVQEPIAKGMQLCYDYGPDYWAQRTAPVLL